MIARNPGATLAAMVLLASSLLACAGPQSVSTASISPSATSAADAIVPERERSRDCESLSYGIEQRKKHIKELEDFATKQTKAAPQSVFAAFERVFEGVDPKAQSARVDAQKERAELTVLEAERANRHCTV